MRIDIATLFPEMCDNALAESIIGRARRRGHIELYCHQIRDYTHNRQKQVDDYPYGGGHGMIMQAQPVYDCCRHIIEQVQAAGRARPRVIFLTAAGTPLTEAKCKELAACDSLLLVCGHYEGMDERVIEALADEELSIGDYVLTGGELAALVVADSVFRLCPGVLSCPEGYEDESHYNGLLEYPQYSRPEEWNGRRVPEILLSGHHANIEKWRRAQSLERTRLRRPDLYEHYQKYICGPAAERPEQPAPKQTAGWPPKPAAEPTAECPAGPATKPATEPAPVPAAESILNPAAERPEQPAPEPATEPPAEPARQQPVFEAL